MPNMTKTIETIHLARKGVYTFLERVYILMPGDKLYGMITDILPQLHTIADSSDGQEMKEGAQALSAFFEERNALSGEKLSEFDLEAQRKYTSLLCLASSVPTAESYYISGSQMFMQDAYDKMRALLQKYRLNLSKSVYEYDDHISVELAFMAKLAAISANALADGNDAVHQALIHEQADMHTNHFDKWIHLFAERVFTDKLSQGERLYNACTKFLSGFLKEDKLLLAELQ